MELDDLKKSWKEMDEKLQTKQLINDDELNKIVQTRKNSAYKSQKALLGNNLIILITSLILIAYFIITGETQKPLFPIIIGLAAIAIPWSIYTMRYLRKTNIYEMPLATVIERINRYNYWMTIERVAGALILFILALISVIHLQIWKTSGWFPYFVCGIWIAGFIAYFLIVNKITFRRLRDIRRNLDELKEVDDTE